MSKVGEIVFIHEFLVTGCLEGKEEKDNFFNIKSDGNFRKERLNIDLKIIKFVELKI